MAKNDHDLRLDLAPTLPEGRTFRYTLRIKKVKGGGRASTEERKEKKDANRYF